MAYAPPPLASLDSFRWRHYCCGLFHTPIAASVGIRHRQAITEENLSGASQLSSVILIEDNAIYTESDAVIQILARLSPPWSWIALLRIIPRLARDACYRFIVRHRYQWFGRTEACQIPSADDRSRFVEKSARDTMSRIVTDSELSASILWEAAKHLIDSR